MPIELEPQDPRPDSDLVLPVGVQGGGNLLSQFLLPNIQGIKPTPKPAGLQVNVGAAPTPQAGAFKPGGAAVPKPAPTTSVPVAQPAQAATPAAAQPAAQADADPIQQELQDPDTQRLLAETMIGEGNTPQMQQAVMETILNRARLHGQSIREVILEQNQFTSMDEGVPGSHRSALDAQAAAGSPAFEGALHLIRNPKPEWKIDPNITHFYDLRSYDTMRTKYPDKYPEGGPAFARGRKPSLSIGTTNFYPGDFPHGGKQNTGSDSTYSDDFATQQAIKYATPTPEMMAQINEDRTKARYWLDQGIKAQGAMGQMYDAQIEAIQSDRKHMDEMWERYRATTDRLLADFPDRKKMEEDELRKVSDQPRDPTRVLGQFLPMLAILGGAFTRAGAIGSLKAAGAAMSAAQSHDEEALKRADAEYHDAIQETLDKAQIVHQELTEGIAQAQGDMNSIIQMGQIYGAKANIPMLIAAAYQKDTDSILAVPQMLGQAWAQIATIQRNKLQDAHTSMEIERLRRSLDNGGPGVPYTDQATGQTIYYHGQAEPGKVWTDGYGVPLANQNPIASHLQTGRLYSGESGYFNSLQTYQETHGGPPLTPDQYLKGHVAFLQSNKAEAMLSGAFGNSVQSMDNVISHLAVLDQLADALNNGDIRLFNGLAQGLAKDTGQPAPTNFEEAKAIVGDEIAKALTSANTAEGDRKQAQDAFRLDYSSQQNAGASGVARQLLLRQLNNMRLRFDANNMGQGRPFTDFLSKDVGRLLSDESPAATTTEPGVPILGPGGKPTGEVMGGGGGVTTAAKTNAPHVLSEEDRTHWMNSVRKGRELVREGKITKQQFTDGLKEHFGDVGDQALGQASEGL